MKAQFKILTKALPLFLELASGNHELSLNKVQLFNKRELMDKHTLFDFEETEFGFEHQSRTVLEHCRNIAYEYLIENHPSNN